MILYTTKVAATALAHSRMPRISLDDSVVLERRAMPWDCDNNLHINNARYLWLMDFGRTAWIARIGLLGPVVRGKVHFLVGGATLTYRRSVELWEPYRLETRLLGWDARWFYFEQVFRKANGDLAVRALLRGMAREGAQAMTPRKLLSLVDVDLGAEEWLDDELRSWIASADETLLKIKADASTPGQDHAA